MNRRRFLSLSAAALLPTPAAAQSWRGRALGADVDVTLTGPGTQAALDAIPALLNGIEAQFSLYRDSALTRLNRDGHLVPDTMFADLCALCDRLHTATDGLFDPTVQPLWRALATGAPILPARSAIGWHRVTLGARIGLDHGQAMTFNGVAQGFAADVVRAHLAARGFTQALVNMGEYAALGGPFTVSIDDPAAGQIGQTRITGAALATSSPAALLVGGLPHILHPKGQPALWSTVTVQADSAALADGLSTALVFATRDQARRIRDRLAGVHTITLIDNAGDLTTI